MELVPRFIDEKIGDHWAVDETTESFSRLMQHLVKTTRFKPHFERALSDWRLYTKPEGLVVADIGAGVAWTSSVMALRPEISKIFVVEPSKNRLNRAEAIAKHLNAPREKLVFIEGTFENPRVPVNVDIVNLCASIHHCFDEEIPKLFDNIRNMLVPKGVLLLSNEHFVNRLYSIRLFLSWIRYFPNRSLNWRTPPDPWSGEHVRFKHELDNIFNREGFDVNYFPLEGNLCDRDAKWRWIDWITWTYYYAILHVKSD